MSTLKDITVFANELLMAHRFQDYCPNGIQVEGKNEVKQIISGVSASYEFFDLAHKEKADLIIVHHGILWGKEPVIINGSFKKRLSILLAHDISLMAYHLPLDAHNEIGNNALVANYLGLKKRETFANYKGNDIGVIGYLDNPMNRNDFLDKVKTVFDSDLISYFYGNQNIKKIAVVTGGAAEQITNAVERECDVYITGEVSESTMHLAKEENMNFIAAGHYNTEKFAVQALGERLAKEFNLNHKFIDIPNPI